MVAAGRPPVPLPVGGALLSLCNVTDLVARLDRAQPSLAPAGTVAQPGALDRQLSKRFFAPISPTEPFINESSGSQPRRSSILILPGPPAGHERFLEPISPTEPFADEGSGDGDGGEDESEASGKKLAKKPREKRETAAKNNKKQEGDQ